MGGGVCVCGWIGETRSIDREVPWIGIGAHQNCEQGKDDDDENHGERRLGYCSKRIFRARGITDRRRTHFETCDTGEHQACGERQPRHRACGG